MRKLFVFAALSVAVALTIAPPATASSCSDAATRCINRCSAAGHGTASEACVDKCDADADSCSAGGGDDCPVWMCPPYGFFTVQGQHHQHRPPFFAPIDPAGVSPR